MRKVTMLATALIAVLALSVGAFAYPAVVGVHPLSTAHAAPPATVSHPKNGDDNSTGNQTNENETGDNDSQGNQTGDQGNETGDQGNETEGDAGMSMGNVTVEHNVTVTHVNTTTYVNGTIMVIQNGTTIVSISFRIVSGMGNATANVTINGTQVVGSETVTVQGLAVYSFEDRSVEVAGVASASQGGSLLWQRAFQFELPDPVTSPS